MEITKEILREEYQAPRATKLHIQGLNILLGSSFLIDEGLEEGDPDTFEPLD